jgi:hypothetical protein
VLILTIQISHGLSSHVSPWQIWTSRISSQVIPWRISGSAESVLAHDGAVSTATYCLAQRVDTDPSWDQRPLVEFMADHQYQHNQQPSDSMADISRIRMSP